MAANYPEDGMFRGSHHRSRPPHFGGRGRGSTRNGPQEEVSTRWDSSSQFQDRGFNGSDLPQNVNKSRRGRGVAHRTRVHAQSGRSSGNHMDESRYARQQESYTMQESFSNYTQDGNHQLFPRTELNHYQPSEGAAQQRNHRQFQHFRARNFDPDQYQEHHIPLTNSQNPSIPSQDSRTFYGARESAQEENYPPTAVAPSKHKQSKGPRSGDYRKDNGRRQNGHTANADFAATAHVAVEHQPFENIGRDYAGGRSSASRSQQRNRPNRSQEARHRRGEIHSAPTGSYASQDVRLMRDDGGAPGPSQDRFRQREEGPVSTSSQPPKSTGRSGSSRSYETQNWRTGSYKKEEVRRGKAAASKLPADTATQRERLTTQLTNGTYECMVCCESVKPVQPTWSCSQCYHVFHLGCVKRWSLSSQDESGQWRCPGCQSINASLPSAYLCFCSKQKDPEWNRRETPHSCGEVCGKALDEEGLTGCIHTCTLLCHPGPCPTCSAQTQRKCPCGKTSQLVKCGSSDALLCGAPCGKLLSCGLHSCLETCHVGECPSCPLTVQQKCFCDQSTREVPCSVDHPEDERFACDLICSKKLDCGHHCCEKACHAGECGSCKLQVGVVKTCPCGKCTLQELYRTKSLPERKNCADPVPVCGSTCGKILPCGPQENPHTCASVCHSGSCPPCTLSTFVRCRCGKNEKEIACKALGDVGEVLCERRCNKKRQCGRHKCVQVCCVDAEHICPLVCQRQLSCGKHRCEALCHAGNCNRCFNVSFDELRCHCGTQVIYPPVPCGARPPDCTKPCTRPRSCGHPQVHNCHPDSTPCPPCVALCEKLCYGKHELRKNVPCHLTEVSCGKPCGKPLKCGRHTCTVTCHTGPCPSTCSQPCPVPRTECGHPCGLPCHAGSCPSTPCREKVKVQCQCGQRTATVSCEENEISYRKLATGLLASKMAQLQSGETVVDLKDLLGGSSAVAKTKSLDCNEECALVERNRRLALALQIKNPNPKPGAPPYPELLKNWAKKDPRFVQMVHDRLTELVQLAKQSVGKMKSRSHSFDSMNRDKRQFIHEYCVFFGCESMSYDEEPKRNVVATAYGELSFLPAVGIMDVARRELGQRKMPAPPRTAGGLTVLTPASQQQQPQVQQSQPVAQQVKPAGAWGAAGGSTTFRTLSEVVKSTPVPSAPATPAVVPAAKPSEPPKPPVVDYFDFTS